MSRKVESTPPENAIATLSNYFEKHFPLNAPVVAVAMLTKNSDVPGPNDPTDPTTPLENKKIILDSNASDATLTNENGLANQRQRNVNVAAKKDNSGYENTSLPTTSNINLYRERLHFHRLEHQS